MNSVSALWLMTYYEMCSENKKKNVLIKFCRILSFVLYHVPSAYSKDKFCPRTGREGPKGEERYSSTLSLPSALDGVGGQLHAPAASYLRGQDTHCTGGWVGPRAGLDGRGNSRIKKVFVKFF